MTINLLHVCLSLVYRSTRTAAEPVKRLWRSLVHQESVQEMMIGYVFKIDPLITREAINDSEVSCPLMLDS